MNVVERLDREFRGLKMISPRTLRDLLQTSHYSLADLVPHLGPPGIFPYGRKLLFRNDDAEVLVMNWAARQVCAPHDHGNSWGWVKFIQGDAYHGVYRFDSRNVPVLHKEKCERQGKLVFAPQGLIHAMGSISDEPLVTLHVYSPPITRMRVYDISRCVGCVVADDCGAWWPTDQRQLLEAFRLGERLGDGKFNPNAPPAQRRSESRWPLHVFSECTATTFATTDDTPSEESWIDLDRWADDGGRVLD